MRMFRFPRWTVTVLVIALVIALAGIGISASIVRDTLSGEVSISPRWRFFFPEVLQALVGITYVLGLLGFVYLAARGRTFVQRLTAAKAWPAQNARNR